MLKEGIVSGTALADRLMWLLTAVLFASLTIFNMTSASSKGVFILAGLIFLLHSYKKAGKIVIPLHCYQISILGFALFGLLSAVWSISSSEAISKGVSIIEICVCMTIVYMCYLDFPTIDPLLSAVMWGGYIIAAYFIRVYGGLNIALSDAANGIRNGVDFANVNAIGRVMAIVIVINVYFLAYHKFKIYYLGIILPTIALVVTQSRTPLIEAGAGIILIILIKNIKKGDFFQTLLKILIASFLLFGALLFLLRLPMFHGVSQRMMGLFSLYTGEGHVDTSALLRQKMIKLGFELFCQHPLLGVGLGNVRFYAAEYLGKDTYLHNNFAEMMAGGGIVGVLCYYQMHAYLIYWLLKSKISTNGKSAVCLVIVLLLILSDYGAVSYYYKETYFLLAICYLHLYKRNFD